MKGNPDKCHLLVSTKGKVAIRIKNTKREELLGIQFYNKLSFDYHLSEICKKPSRKLYVQLFPTYMVVGCVIVASLTKK